MATNKFIILGNLELVFGENDNSLATVNEKIAELTNEIIALKEQIANTNNIKTITSEPLLPSGYVLAKDSDFIWRTDDLWKGAWHYIGKDKKVIIPHTIQGKEVTSYRSMFYRTSVIGVYSDNQNVTNMSCMFFKSEATSLDLAYLNTSNVTDMSYMFSSSNATELYLSSFDTSNVTNMECMFYGSKVPTLDLSSFDTSNVTNIDYMFHCFLATNGYARTQEDADRLNKSFYSPRMKFVVKPQIN